MKLSSDPSQHLTYCLNVHPGETWAENLAAIRSHTLAIRDRVCPGKPFGLGLRLSDAASRTLAQPDTLAAFASFLAEHNLYVFTVNGFPYGAFHGTQVKEAVYRPDWREPERAAYTKRLADIVAALLPEGVNGSISTVPCSYKTWIRSDADRAAMVENLMDVVGHLAGVHERTGRLIHVGLEPEPDCWLETTEEAIAFFEQDLDTAGAQRLEQQRGCTREAARGLIRRHLGVCVDTCHVALQFEDVAQSMRRLHRHGIRISKVQISAALCVAGSAAPELERFVDPVYLHQVKVRDASGAVTAYADLPAALAAGSAGSGGEWRVHFHVPLYFESLGSITSTAGVLDSAFFAALAECEVEHAEIETYTFSVLPAAAKEHDIVGSVALEYAWLLARFSPNDAG